MKMVFVLPPYDYSKTVGNRRKKTQIGLLPPLGVGYLAASIAARGHTAALVDAVAEQLDLEETAARVMEEAPDAIGISSFTTYTPNDAYALARALRARAGRTPIIMGGPHVTSFARSIFEECPEVDILVPGDGEAVLTELLDRLQDGRSYADLHGILYKNTEGETVSTAASEVVYDIDRFPHPDRHLYRNELYVPLPSLSARRPVTSMITSRGCPWAKCKFCYQGGEFAVPYRRRTPENVVDEIRQLVRERGIRNIVFWDDNFCVNPKWIHRFCDLLDAERLHVIWSVLGRVNTVNPEMLRRMAASGCYSVQYGIETGSPEILKMVNKGHTLDECRQAVRWAKEAGLETRAFFVLGFPKETPEMSEQTIRFACELNVDYVVFFSYHVAPGTALAELALCEGKCGAYEGQHLPSYVPNTYGSAAELGAIVKSAYQRYYFRPAYMARALYRLIKQPSLIKNHLSGFYYWFGLMFSR